MISFAKIPSLTMSFSTKDRYRESTCYALSMTADRAARRRVNCIGFEGLKSPRPTSALIGRGHTSASASTPSQYYQGLLLAQGDEAIGHRQQAVGHHRSSCKTLRAVLAGNDGHRSSMIAP